MLGWILNKDPFFYPTIDISGLEAVFVSSGRDCQFTVTVYLQDNICLNKLECVSPDVVFDDCSVIGDSVIGDNVIGGCCPEVVASASECAIGDHPIGEYPIGGSCMDLSAEDNSNNSSLNDSVVIGESVIGEF